MTTLSPSFLTPAWEQLPSAQPGICILLPPLSLFLCLSLSLYLSVFERCNYLQHLIKPPQAHPLSLSQSRFIAIVILHLIIPPRFTLWSLRPYPTLSPSPVIPPSLLSVLALSLPLLLFRHGMFSPVIRLSEMGQIAKYLLSASPRSCRHYPTPSFYFKLVYSLHLRSALPHKARLSSHAAAGLISRLSCSSAPATRGKHFDALATCA